MNCYSHVVFLKFVKDFFVWETEMSKQSFFLAVLYFKIDFQILEWDFVPFWINNLLFKNFVSRCLLWWPLGIDVLSNFWYIWDIQHYGTQGYLTQWDLLSYPSNIQLKSDETAQLLNKPYVNEVTLRGQKQPLECWQPLTLLTLL